MIQIELPGYLPQPAQRPRIYKKKNWNPWTAKAGEQGYGAYSPSAGPELGLAWMMRAAMPNVVEIPLLCEAEIEIEIQHWSTLRGDVDNLAKFVMDATQKAGIVKNDCQYKKLVIEIRPAEADKTIIRIRPFDPSVDPSVDQNTKALALLSDEEEQNYPDY